MRLLLLSLAILAGGCAADGGAASSAPQEEMFRPRTVRLHPVFTKLEDWTGDGRADGIEALVELRDQFDDPCKGAGALVFELYEYAANQPDPRGRRAYNPWQVEIQTINQQRERWSKTSRCYSFRLAADKINKAGRYVLTVSFAPEGGPRLFDRAVIGPSRAATP